MLNFPRQAQKQVPSQSWQCLFFSLGSMFHAADIKGIVSGPLEWPFLGSSKTPRDYE